jgi:hypothetical protein
VHGANLVASPTMVGAGSLRWARSIADERRAISTKAATRARRIVQGKRYSVVWSGALDQRAYADIDCLSWMRKPTGCQKCQKPLEYPSGTFVTALYEELRMNYNHGKQYGTGDKEIYWGVKNVS